MENKREMDFEKYNRMCMFNILKKIPIELNEEQINFIVFTMLKMYSFSEETYNHSIHTLNIACVLAKKLELSKEDAGILELAALVHDFGKLKIDKEILHSTKKLSPKEFETIKSHSQNTFDMIKDVLPDKVALTAYHHHEKLNGTGYPQHLQAEQLTELDKMLTVCDITSALVLKRSYKAAMDKVGVRTILTDMVAKGEIDKEYTKCVIDSYVNKIPYDYQNEEGLIR